MKYVTYLFLLIGLNACSDLVLGNYYNKLDLYQLGTLIESSNFRGEDSRQKEKTLVAIRYEKTPKTLRKASALVRDLRYLGIKKIAIPFNKFSQINEILFKQKGAKETKKVTKQTGYDNILVFRRDARIVGVMKICFDCHQHYTMGIEHQTRNFGENGDYEKLNKILQ